MEARFLTVLALELHECLVILNADFRAPLQNHWLRISGSRAWECAFLISPGDSDVANWGFMLWETLFFVLWPNEGKWLLAYSLQWPASVQGWHCLSWKAGLGCTVGQRFNRVVMSKKGQPHSLPRRDQVQPRVSELGPQELSRADFHLFMCVLLICAACSTSWRAVLSLRRECLPRAAPALQVSRYLCCARTAVLCEDTS